MLDQMEESTLDNFEEPDWWQIFLKPRVQMLGSAYNMKVVALSLVARKN